MNIKKVNHAKYLISVSVVLLFAWLHQVYVSRAHPDAVYMDSLRLVYQLEQWRQGQLPFLQLWGIGAEHQGFINQILLLLNVKYFSFDVMLANRLTGFAVALVTMVILLNFNSGIWKFGKEFSGKLLVSRVGISVLLAMICFSWAGFELFTLDLGLPLWLKNLSFVTYFATHACYLMMPTRGRRPYLVGLGLTLAGPVIVLMIGMGWSYSFVAAVLAVNLLVAAESISKRDVCALLQKSVPTIALLLAQIVYLMASIGVGHATAPHQKFSTLLQVPELLLYALGSGLIGVETVVNYPVLLHVLPYVSGGALAAAFILVLARYRRDLRSRSLLPIYLLGYGFLTALSVSAARGGDGAMAVMASRYYMDIMLFYVGLIWLWYDNLEYSLPNKSHISKRLFLALCLAAVMGHALTYKREWAAAPYRAAAFKSMNQALQHGVPDQRAASLLQSPLENARKGDQVLLEHHLALYASLPADVCRADDIHYLSGWYAKESQGLWMGRSAVVQIPPCQCDLVASIYLPSNFPGRSLMVSDAESKQTNDLTPGKVAELRISPSGVQRTLEISVSKTTIPSSLPGGAHDMRDLGALWTSNVFACGSNAFN